MTHRQPKLKDQARQLRDTLATRGHPLSQGESLELVSKLNGYPSWNVAKKAATGADVVEDRQCSVEFRLWTAVHNHRHGEDILFFTHEPTDEEIIAAINARSSYEPEQGEYFELRGVDVFNLDPSVLQVLPPVPVAPLITMYEINVNDLVDYEVPDDVPAWKWVENLAAFAHRGNGEEQGVWEFMIHHDKLRANLASVPTLLRADIGRALSLGAVWVMFHQG